MTQPKPEGGRTGKAIVIALLLLLLVIAVALAYTRRQQAPSASRPAQAEGKAVATAEAPAIVFVDTLAGRLGVALRPSGEAQPAAIYQTQAMTSDLRVPDDFGIFPSADGKYLLVWESEAEQDRTKWTLLLLPNGEEISSGETQGPPRILPHWQKEGTLGLVGNAAMGIVDPEFLTRWMHLDHAFRLPKPVPEAGLSKALLAYADRYLETSDPAFSRLLKSPSSQTGLAGYLATHGRPPDQYLLLRGTGLPSDGVLRTQGAPGGNPEVTFTPDRKRFALATEGHLAAFEAGTQKQLWALTDAQGSSAQCSDLRWSPDGRFLSFTSREGDASTILIIDSASWEKVLELPQAANAFVLP
jgi:hypothetical protein